MKHELEIAKTQIDQALHQLNTAPEKGQIADLIAACEVIDMAYKLMCREDDDDMQVPAGTSYKEGMDIEFYIEASWWHDVSVALRELKK
jgi:hypothetical protein